MRKFTGKKAQVQIKASLHKRLKSLAKKNNMTLFDVVDEAIKEYLMAE